MLVKVHHIIQVKLIFKLPHIQKIKMNIVIAQHLVINIKVDTRSQQFTLNENNLINSYIFYLD
jgi:hypothetical protein